MQRNRPALFKGRHFESEIIVLCVPLVSSVWTQLPEPGRTYGRAEPQRGSRHDLALVQRYAPELNRRCRPELRMTNRSWRVDETYLRVAGKWTYLYRAVDSTGATIDFLLSARRDAAAAKRFFQKALQSLGHPRPRVINVDGNPSYPKVVAELKRSRELGPTV
jgi:IS6 family transposase